MREKLAHLIDVLNTPKGDILSEGFQKIKTKFNRNNKSLKRSIY